MAQQERNQREGNGGWQCLWKQETGARASSSSQNIIWTSILATSSASINNAAIKPAISELAISAPPPPRFQNMPASGLNTDNITSPHNTSEPQNSRHNNLFWQRIHLRFWIPTWPWMLDSKFNPEFCIVPTVIHFYETRTHSSRWNQCIWWMQVQNVKPHCKTHSSQYLT